VTAPTVSDRHDLLRGTPVFPGLVLGPVLVVSREISPAAIRRFEEQPSDDLESALAAYDAAAAAVADGMEKRAANAEGRWPTCCTPQRPWSATRAFPPG
jgi:hypothetical protein